jgi:hypothetical protein
MKRYRVTADFIASQMIFGEAESAAARRLLVGTSVVKYCQVQNKRKQTSVFNWENAAQAAECITAARMVARSAAIAAAGQVDVRSARPVAREERRCAA